MRGFLVQCVMRIGALLLVLLLAGCFARVSPPPTEPQTPAAQPRAEVRWVDYGPDVKERIDAMEAAADCVGLQAEFDTADANNDIVQERTGHNNADLMRYIDEALELAGCYD